ncbi:MAG TPA: hypothetical protein VH228_16535 [Nocardioides sp.]|jgi:hypothetical protein|nr:hypothetical protein [Nocardioides sp.]
MTTAPLALARPPASRESRRVPILLGVAWAAVFLNVMAYSRLPTVVPIPGAIGQLLTQGALPAALLLALVMNPKGVLRPQVYLVGFTVMAVIMLAVSIHGEFLMGSTFRASRFVGFMAVLWLLSPWFGRRDMMLLRCHRICLITVLVLVVLGAMVSPGLAFSFEGRLSGVLWPVPPTQVAHYAAVVFGTSALLWMCQVISGRNALACIALSGVVLVGTHTRTALIAMAVGMVVAGLSLFVGHSRVRRTSLWAILLVLATVGVFANELKTWALRGQSAQEAGDLTGRTKVWSAVFHTPRPAVNDWFGSGMSNLSFGGLPIDSNWVGTFYDQGWFGVVLDAAIVLVLLVVAATRERSPHRAIAIFLIIYCIFASITETGLSNPSPYLLDLAVAASLILPWRQEAAR